MKLWNKDNTHTSARVEAFTVGRDREFDLLHVVMPNPDYRRGALGHRGMKFASFYVDPECGKVVRRGGYNTQRYSVARGTKAPGEVYGRSPSMLILPEPLSMGRMRCVPVSALGLSGPCMKPPVTVNLPSTPSFVM